MRPVNLLAGLLVTSAWIAPVHADHPAPEGGTLRCESSDGRTRECPVDASGGARLLRQLSRSPCIEGETWGRTRRSIWVTQGCRGEFLALSDGRGRGYGAYAPSARLLRCGSDNGRWNHCGADTRRGVELVRQLSRSRCVRGQSWGVDRTGIWVNGGCRAEFRLGAEPVGWEASPQPGRFRCESSDGRVRTCAVGGRGGVRLVKQLSRSPCIAGETWGMEREGVWVSNGCRAEFEIGEAWADGRW